MEDRSAGTGAPTASVEMAHGIEQVDLNAGKFHEISLTLHDRRWLVLRWRLANVFQDMLAQQIRIALAGFRESDDLICKRLLDVVVAVPARQRGGS